MPEWSTYVANNREFAGTACHKESGYLQEIAQEVSMRERQHIWVDGSLSDGEWFKKIFEDIRKRFPHYRIAILYISASEATIRGRIAKRTAETGRSIPESQIRRSLQCPESSLAKLAPYTDIVARIWNENAIQLKCVEDYSGNWYRGLGRLFNAVETDELKFPHSLSTLYLEKTSFLGTPFRPRLDFRTRDALVTIGSKYDWASHRQAETMLKEGYLEKEGRFRMGMSKRYFKLRPGYLSYYRDCNDTLLKGEFSLLGNFELLPNTTADAAATAASKGKRPSGIVDAMMGALIPTAKRTESLKTDTGFYIRGFHTDGTGYSIGLVAPTAAAKQEWIDAISAAIAQAKSNYHSENGDIKEAAECTVTLDFTKASLVSSPNLRILATRLNPISIEATPELPWISKESETHSVTGAPPDTTHFRFLFPSAQVQSMLHKSVVTGVEDPDFLLLIFGGFAYLDADGKVLGTQMFS